MFGFFFKMGLTKEENRSIILGLSGNAPLAQLDRVFGYEPKGRGFESLTARQSIHRTDRPRAGSCRSFFRARSLPGRTEDRGEKPVFFVIFGYVP